MRIGFTRHPSAGLCLLIDNHPESEAESETIDFYKKPPYAQGRNTKRALRGEDHERWGVLVPLEWS